MTICESNEGQQMIICIVATYVNRGTLFKNLHVKDLVSHV